MIEPFGRFSSDRRPKEEKADLRIATEIIMLPQRVCTAPSFHIYSEIVDTGSLSHGESAG
jgi:hypothetical protein